MTTTYFPPPEDRPIEQPKAFPLFCTTQEASHKIHKDALDTVNDLLVHLANLVEENERLRHEIQKIKKS